MGQERQYNVENRILSSRMKNNPWVRTILAVIGVTAVTFCLLICCMFYTTGSFRGAWKKFVCNVAKSTSLSIARSESNVMGYLEYSQNSVEGGPIVQAFSMMIPIHTCLIHADDVDFEGYVQMAKAAINDDKDEKLRLAQADYDKFLYYNGKVYGDHYGSGVQNVKENVDVTQIMNGQDTNMISQESYLEDESTVVDTASIPTTSKSLTLSQVAAFEDLIKQCYTVDRTTVASKSLFQAEKLAKKDLSLDMEGSKPQILLYHTHSQERFYDSQPGKVSDTIVGVGDVLAKILEEDYGVRVIHDRNTYDLVDGKLMRDGAYTRALPSLERILDDNPAIEVMIDLHRDGMPTGMDPKEGKRVTTIDGEECAQIMLFNGLSANTKGEIQDLPNENLEDNLAFSFQMYLDGKNQFANLMKPIYLKPYRFNLHLKPRATLVELGTQYNTVAEAKNSMKYLAKIIMDVLQKKDSTSMK